MLRNLFVSTTETEAMSHVKNDLRFRRDRSFDRKKAELLRLLRLTKVVEVKSPGGIIIRDDLAFDFNTPAVNAFVIRLCRGLLWEEFRIEYFSGTFDWRMNVELEDAIYEGMAAFGRVRKVHDIFAYGVTAPKNGEPGWVVMNFYGSLEIWARITIQR